MLFTREVDYAIRTLHSLKSGEKYSVKMICTNEDIPEAFTYKILKKLEKANLISITRGIYGGYQLNKDLSEITLFDIVVAVEPNFVLSSYMKEGGRRSCKFRVELHNLQDVIVERLEQTSMKEILE